MLVKMTYPTIYKAVPTTILNPCSSMDNKIGKEAITQNSWKAMMNTKSSQILI